MIHTRYTPSQCGCDLGLVSAPVSLRPNGANISYFRMGALQNPPQTVEGPATGHYEGPPFTARAYDDISLSNVTIENPESVARTLRYRIFGTNEGGFDIFTWSTNQSVDIEETVPANTAITISIDLTAVGSETALKSPTWLHVFNGFMELAWVNPQRPGLTMDLPANDPPNNWNVRFSTFHTGPEPLTNMNVTPIA